MAVLRRVWRQVVPVLGVLGTLAAAAPSSAAQRVLLVSSTAEDPRIEVVRGALSFWSDTFVELGLAPQLVETGILIAPPTWRALENFAWQISRLAGHLPEGTLGPPAPPEVLALEGDVLVLLSAQPLLPFARPLPGTGRYLVAIPGVRRQAQETGADRNVVAHELGHVLGLRHGDDPTALMCEPCPFTSDHEDGFRRLSAADRARLIELYGAPQRPARR